MTRKNDSGQAAEEFYKLRREWLGYLSTHSDVSHVTFRVAYFIANRMNGDNQSSWWSRHDIAKQIGASPRSVSDAIGSLEDIGVLIVVRSKGAVNEYHIRLPYAG